MAGIAGNPFGSRGSTPLINISPNSMYNRSVGLPTTPWAQRKADESAEILRAMAERESDPEVKAALEQAIEQGTYSSMSPLEAAQASLADAENRSVEDRNVERDSAALQLLGAEYGMDNLSPDLIEQFGLDTDSPLGTRTDRARSDILNRLGQEQTGFEQRETGLAEQAAARRGSMLSEQDSSAIRNRGATLFGRQRQAELGDLRREETAGQRSALGGLVNTLTGTTFEGGNYGALLGEAAANRPSFTSGLIGRQSRGGSSRNSYGFGLSGGGESRGGNTNIISRNDVDRRLAKLGIR